MEYIEHGDLAQYIATHGDQAKRDAREITSQVLEGLAVLHERRICHRDLKPQVCYGVLLVGRRVVDDVEYPPRGTLADLGEDHGLRHREELGRHVAAESLRDDAVPGAGDPSAAACAAEGREYLVHE